MDRMVKRTFLAVDLAAPWGALIAARERGALMPQPRLLLIDDEPALADFVANAASGCGFEPVVTSDDGQFREEFLAQRPDMVALDLGMPGMDGVELIRFLADEDYRSPVLIISGFDRRVLESAFRLGEALGLSMAGQLEKPVRLEALESMLSQLKATLVI
jgi:DNA-binding response OmpR family regulator